jgi:DNA helicase-2/ATP-dependent DNA helicase PcrA
LVLTHTHAGVEALRTKLRRLEVPAAKSEVDTIAGWTLRLATAFPATAGIANFSPRDGSGYSAVYGAAERLLRLTPIREIIRASYSGVMVDEYQDCTLDQHEVVLRLLDVLPCRIVGDPMQGIFDFGDNHPVEWTTHVDSIFEEVPGPVEPWRWRQSNPALGEWLLDARTRLGAGEGLDLEGAPVAWYDCSDPTTARDQRLRACHAAAAHESESVMAIHRMPGQVHDVAKRLNGRYTCVEAIDTKDLYRYANSIGNGMGCVRAVSVLDFASICMTRVKNECNTIRQALLEDRIPKVRKHARVLEALCAVIAGESHADVEAALVVIERETGAVVYRRELLCEMKRALRAVVAGDAATLAEAAWVVRNRARRIGRMISRCSVGTTLLVKGLEFDHVVVLDGDVFDAHNLYVAITRGSRSLTIVSKSRSIVTTSPSTARTGTLVVDAEATQ